MSAPDTTYTPGCGDRDRSGCGDRSDMGAAYSGAQQPSSTAFLTASAIVRDAMLADLHGSRLSREEVALELSRVAGRAVSLAMLDAYLSETKQHHRFPAELLPAWVHVLGSARVLMAVCGQAGLSLATQEDRDFAELGRAELRRRKLGQSLWERI